MFVNSDFSDLLKIFNDKSVQYLIIGGYAVIQHGEPRYTKDLDVWIATNAENGIAIYGALKEFGAPLANLSAEDFMGDGYFYQMGSPPVRIDIMMGIPGVNFVDAWARRVEVNYDGLWVKFISKEDLIVAKFAAGRPQDLIDAANLGGKKVRSTVKPKQVRNKRK